MKKVYFTKQSNDKEIVYPADEQNQEGAIFLSATPGGINQFIDMCWLLEIDPIKAKKEISKNDDIIIFEKRIENVTNFYVKTKDLTKAKKILETLTGHEIEFESMSSFLNIRKLTEI